jgi:hypothetical protein
MSESRAMDYVVGVNKLVIEARYDEEARVWVAVNQELWLATEAEAVDVLTYKLQEMVPELATLNNLEVSRPVRFTLRSVRHATAFACCPRTSLLHSRRSCEMPAATSYAWGRGITRSGPRHTRESTFPWTALSSPATEGVLV